jgi:hypothetical protein
MGCGVDAKDSNSRCAREIDIVGFEYVGFHHECGRVQIPMKTVNNDTSLQTPRE